MFSRLKELYRFIDDTVEDIKKQHPDQVVCKPGCADCCHAVFDVSFIEAAYIASFLTKNQEIRLTRQEHAQEAAVRYEKLLQEKSDIAKERIRCPLLADDDLCLAHEVRPINCRTYGTPTVINGKTHVCGISGFESMGKYPTIDLAPLQKALKDYSVAIVGEDFGNRRFPIAWVILKTSFFLPPDNK